MDAGNDGIGAGPDGIDSPPPHPVRISKPTATRHLNVLTGTVTVYFQYVMT